MLTKRLFFFLEINKFKDYQLTWRLYKNMNFEKVLAQTELSMRCWPNGCFKILSTAQLSFHFMAFESLFFFFSFFYRWQQSFCKQKDFFYLLKQPTIGYFLFCFLFYIKRRQIRITKWILSRFTSFLLVILFYHFIF